MGELTYTLVSDGASDVMLLSVVDWLLIQHSTRSFHGRWADLRRLARPPVTLSQKIATAIELYPCDLLLVHRDAERQVRESRIAEIRRGLPSALTAGGRWIPIVPVRMQEAWFLHSGAAIREAAGNPSGAVRLSLPAVRALEGLPDPKATLESLLKEASGLGSRRRSKMRLGPAKHRLAALMDDFATLRVLPSFSAFEADVRRLLRSQGW